MVRDLAEIRGVIKGAMKEMAKLKDHVDYQLDLRAPFAFLPFNQITQAPTGAPPISATSGNTAPYPALNTPGLATFHPQQGIKAKNNGGEVRGLITKPAQKTKGGNFFMSRCDQKPHHSKKPALPQFTLIKGGIAQSTPPLPPPPSPLPPRPV